MTAVKREMALSWYVFELEFDGNLFKIAVNIEARGLKHWSRGRFGLKFAFFSKNSFQKDKKIDSGTIKIQNFSYLSNLFSKLLEP